MDYRLKILKEYLDRNSTCNELSIKQIANEMQLSHQTLNQLFKCEFGISTCQYIRELRLEKARELLETSFLQIKQICFEVGFNDQSTFIQYFKTKYACTPLEYRKRNFIHQTKD